MHNDSCAHSMAQNAEEAMQKNKDNTHPWILCVGSPCNVTSAVLVCQHKIISKEIGKTVFSALLVLLAARYTYEFAYNPLVQQILEFLQEKLLGDGLPSSKKISVAYSSLFRAIDCLEQKITESDATEKDSNNDMSEENTQAVCEFD